MPMLLLPPLLLLQLASLLRAATSITTTGSNGSCRHASCGNLPIRYPFSLTGEQPLYCGYPAFDLTCDAGRAYLSNTFRERLFHVHNIYYTNNSMVASVQTSFAGDIGCPVPDFNVSASLALFPFNISATNKRLVFFYNCTVPAELRLPRPCVKQTMGAYISGPWKGSGEGGGTLPVGVPTNCSWVSVPVQRGVERPHLHYARLIADGFLLELLSPLGDCDTCTRMRGECRFDQQSFQCVCPDGKLCLNSTSSTIHPGSWFLTFLWVWWLPLMLVAAKEQVEGCLVSAKRCGNLTISNPFWLTNRKTGIPCGSSGFEVTCFENTAPVLRGSVPIGRSFAIIDIYYKERSLCVVDLGKLVLLEASSSCKVLTWNTSVKLRPPIRIDPVNLNLVFYNCTRATAAAAARRYREPLQTRLKCGDESNMFVHAGGCYNVTGIYAVEGCRATIVPVLGSSSGKASASDYGQLIRDGFLLTWQQPSVSGNERRGKKIMLIGITSAAATFLFACLYVLIWHRKGKRLWLILCKKPSSNTEKNYEAMIVSYGSLAPKRYMYSEVMKITSSRNNELGKGGYGVVFKGTIHDGRLVAVKFLHDCKGNGDEFVNEVMSIGRTSHVNVVSLLGFCLEGSKRALIYEYMCNGSLDRYIYSENPKEILGWERLYAIAIGIARGLEYLHHSCNTRIVHFDIKPQNILLDQEFCPKIADFGLAKLCRTKESKLSMIGARGTIGFIAPEVHSRNFGVVSTKSDVYSYGMMLLEMVGGRKNVKSVAEKSSEKYFPDWIYDHFAQEDGLEACEVTSDIEEIARKMTLIGLWCIQVLPVYRPTITKVLEMFERSLDDMVMPPKQNFSGLLENSAHNMNVQSASSTRSEEIMLVNYGNTQQFPAL